MQARRHWLSFFLLLFAFAAAVPAQDGTVDVAAVIEPATAKPGDKVTLVLTATVSDGWHAYGTLERTNIPVALKPESLQLGGLALDGPAQVPPGQRKTGPMESFPLPNVFTVRQPLRVPDGAGGGKVEVKGALDYQICDAHVCLPPDQATFAATLTIDGPAVARTETAPGLKVAPDEKVGIAAKFDPPTARAGEVSTLVLTVTILDERYHAYGTLEPNNKPVELKPENLDVGVLDLEGDAIVPPGARESKMGIDTYPLPHVFEVKQVVRVPAGTKPATVEVSGALDYQICNENGCDLPTTIDFEAKLVVEAGDARAEATKPPAAPPATPPSTPPAKTGDAAQPADDGGFGGSWWALILACIGGGLFALAMPCTYPMIPITFSFFTKQAEKRGGKVLPLAITYALGIVLMFVGIGAVVAIAAESLPDDAIIQLANHWLVNSVIAVAFLLFAFSLFGWINLQPPRFLTNAAGKASTSGGYLGVFFMGATLVITSFTCTAPIVGSLLASVATAGATRVMVGMGAFGITMALPFLVLSLAPTKVKAMPRSGEWMETLKISLGFLELAATLKFVSMVDIALDWNALPRELFLLLIVAIFGLWALFLFGILRKAGTANDGVGSGRMASGIAVTLIATYLLFGALGYKLDFYMTAFAPPYSAPMVAARASVNGGDGAQRVADTHVIVKDDGDKALEVAKASDKLLLYNFTGFN